MFTFDLTIDTDLKQILSDIRAGLVAWTPGFGYIRFRNNMFQVAEPYVMIDKLSDSWQDRTELELREELDQLLEWINA